MNCELSKNKYHRRMHWVKNTDQYPSKTHQSCKFKISSTSVARKPPKNRFLIRVTIYFRACKEINKTIDKAHKIIVRAMHTASKYQSWEYGNKYSRVPKHGCQIAKEINLLQLNPAVKHWPSLCHKY